MKSDLIYVLNDVSKSNAKQHLASQGFSLAFFPPIFHLLAFCVFFPILQLQVPPPPPSLEHLLSPGCSLTRFRAPLGLSSFLFHLSSTRTLRDDRCDLISSLPPSSHSVFPLIGGELISRTCTLANVTRWLPISDGDSRGEWGVGGGENGDGGRTHPNVTCCLSRALFRLLSGALARSACLFREVTSCSL